jgi:hypothetical protein
LSDDPQTALAERQAEAIPPDVQSVLAEIAAVLEEEGVVLRSEDDLERALDARPELRVRLESAVRAAAENDDTDADEVPDPLLAALQAWIETPDWVSSYRYLEAHPELLNEAGEAALAGLAERATAAGNANAIQVFSEHLELLQRSREVGALAAFASKVGATPERFEQLVMV